MRAPIVVSDQTTAKWLLKEAATIRARDSEYDYVAHSLYDSDSDSEPEDDEWATLFEASRSTWRGIVFYTSHASTGHGDVVWASGEWLASRLLDEEDLASKSILELGAGAGLPSLACASRGATVVATDVAPAAVVCLALAARAYETMSVQRLCWGDGLGREFDVVLAADCVYDPASHAALLETISCSLAPNGYVLVAFALHGNAPDADVLAFFDRARRDFVVTYLGATQLQPSGSMRRCCIHDSKRSLVRAYTLRR